MPYEIQFEKVSKWYGESPALREVRLTLAGGVTTAVVGPTASGKSTLLHLINGLERPDRGWVRIDGEAIDYRRLPVLRRGIGYAVQGSGLFPHLTAMWNITLPAILARWEKSRIRRGAEELMELVGLPKTLADRFPYQLSGGEQQRVGLCRAMMLDPPVFLLDEPFGALDAITRAEIHEEFLKLQHLRPRTIVLVTHDLREAVRLARNLVVLHQGRVEQAGPCAEVLGKPASRFVSHLLESQLSDTPPSRSPR